MEWRPKLAKLQRLTNTNFNPKSAAPAQYAALRSQCQPRPAANAHAPPQETGHPAFSWCQSLPSCHWSLTSPAARSRRSRWFRERRRFLIIQVVARGGSASIAPPTKPRSGARGPWARRRCAMPAGLGTSQADWCLNTVPRRAQHLFSQSIPIRIGKFWSWEGRKRWWDHTISNNFCIIIRIWCLMYPTVMIT